MCCTPAAQPHGALPTVSEMVINDNWTAERLGNSGQDERADGMLQSFMPLIDQFALRLKATSELVSRRRMTLNLCLCSFDIACIGIVGYRQRASGYSCRSLLPSSRQASSWPRQKITNCSHEEISSAQP
jgi:hypothetical protein